MQQSRFGVAIASCATHFTHSLCSPRRQRELAELTRNDVSDVRGGEENDVRGGEQNEQSIPCACVLDQDPAAGSLLCFLRASNIGVDMRTLYQVALDGLDFALSPPARNLALLIAQPAVGNTGARDQAYLLAQVI